MKLKPEKCELFRLEDRYVGRRVSAEGVRIDPKDLEAVVSLKTKTPQTVGDIRRILGFLSYYRSYIKDFSRVARTLYEVLQAWHARACNTWKKIQRTVPAARRKVEGHWLQVENFYTCEEELQATQWEAGVSRLEMGSV